jgi:hypothetical protein
VMSGSLSVVIPDPLVAYQIRPDLGDGLSDPFVHCPDWTDHHEVSMTGRTKILQSDISRACKGLPGIPRAAVSGVPHPVRRLLPAPGCDPEGT